MNITMVSISQTFSSGVIKLLPAWRSLVVQLLALQPMLLRIQRNPVALSSKGIQYTYTYKVVQIIEIWILKNFENRSIPPKPESEGTGAAETLVWNVPINNCGITTTDVPASGNDPTASGYTPAEIHHVIYINPPAASAHVMHQVKLTCKVKALIDERLVLKLIISEPGRWTYPITIIRYGLYTES